MLTRRETLSHEPGLHDGAVRGARSAQTAAPRAALSGPALILDDGGGEPVGVTVPVGWSRIGSSPSSELRFDHPSVSRRHALIVRSDSYALQIIDDRSLTGTYVNGAEVSWSELHDGDELMLGRVRMIVACPEAGSAPLS